MECEYCGEVLDKEEAEDPRRDPGGCLMCDECYHDKYEFTCCWCENYAPEDEQHKMLVVFDAEEAFERCDRETGYREGVYRITDFPYYTSNYFSMWLNAANLERIADVPRGADGEGCACGHLCPDCQRKILKEVAP